MLSKFVLPLLIFCGLFCTSCNGQNKPFSESFEQGQKDAYADAPCALESGTWSLRNALVANTERDKKNGNGCLRIKSPGTAEMLFDLHGDVEQLLITHATYGTDPAAEWMLQYSTNNGQDWHSGGPAVQATGIKNTAVFDLKLTGTVRFRIQNKSGGRLNIDDIQTAHDHLVNAHQSAIATRDNNLALGNPSNANAHDPENFLLERSQYSLSYNNTKGIANWVSWHAGSAWRGDASRCNCFAPDDQLPQSFFKAYTSLYIGKGFDRGHLCPSDDRNSSPEDNAATFRMTNISPQAPNLNRDVWEKLESYCRKLAAQGNELYIIAGSYGKGGIGEKGPRKKIVDNILVPAHYWKVIVILPVGDDDINRINKNTRVIAVDMPNTQDVNTYQWHHYRTSIDAIEAATGYDLLSNIPVQVQKVIEAVTDRGNIR